MSSVSRVPGGARPELSARRDARRQVVLRDVVDELDGASYTPAPTDGGRCLQLPAVAHHGEVLWPLVEQLALLGRDVAQRLGQIGGDGDVDARAREPPAGRPGSTRCPPGTPGGSRHRGGRRTRGVPPRAGPSRRARCHRGTWSATTKSCSAQQTAVGWYPRPPVYNGRASRWWLTIVVASRSRVAVGAGTPATARWMRAVLRRPSACRAAFSAGIQAPAPGRCPIWGSSWNVPRKSWRASGEGSGRCSRGLSPEWRIRRAWPWCHLSSPIGCTGPHVWYRVLLLSAESGRRTSRGSGQWSELQSCRATEVRTAELLNLEGDRSLRPAGYGWGAGAGAGGAGRRP